MAGGGPAADAREISICSTPTEISKRRSTPTDSPARQLRQRLPQDIHHRRTLGGRLLHHVAINSRKMMPTLTWAPAEPAPARSHRWRRQRAPPGRGRGQGRHIYVVDRDAMGKFNATTNNIYQDLTGALGGGVFDAGVLQRHGVLRRRRRRDQSFQDHQAQFGGPASQSALASAIRAPLPAFRRTAPTTRSCGRSRTPVQPCCTPTTRAICTSSTTAARPTQPRSVRRGQQVHHPHDRQRQSLCRDDEQRGSVRAAAVGLHTGETST